MQSQNIFACSVLMRTWTYVFDNSIWVCNSEPICLPCSEMGIAELLTLFLLLAVAFLCSEISTTFCRTEERWHMPATWQPDHWGALGFLSIPRTAEACPSFWKRAHQDMWLAFRYFDCILNILLNWKALNNPLCVISRAGRGERQHSVLFTWNLLLPNKIAVFLPFLLKLSLIQTQILQSNVAFKTNLLPSVKMDTVEFLKTLSYSYSGVFIRRN